MKEREHSHSEIAKANSAEWLDHQSCYKYKKMHTKTHKEKILSCNKSTNAQTNKQRIEARSKSKQGLCTQLAVYSTPINIWR